MQENTRRETLRQGLGAAALLALAEWTPALAQGETDVPFTDVPANFNPSNPNSTTRQFDTRTLDGLTVPKDRFFAIQHFNQPEIDPDAFRLKVTGLLSKPGELSLAEIKKMKSAETLAGYECSGNRGPMQGLSSCGRFTGVPLREVLRAAGVAANAREVVFFGADRGVGEVVFRQNTYKLDQQFGRSMTLEDALKPEPMLAYALNGEPLTRQQGAPLRLIVPGWYGVANVKWLAQINVQEERYLGNYQARWYRSLWAVGGSGREDDPETQWVEREITKLQLKSVIARVRQGGGAHTIHGFVLNDGTPLRTVEVQIDGGPWQKATLDRDNTKYSWKLFTYRWEGATPGEHTIVSRATDTLGRVQPTAQELSRKRTFLEDNSQTPRKVRIG